MIYPTRSRYHTQPTPLICLKLTSQALLDRLSYLHSPSWNDQSHNNPLLHPFVSRIYAVLPTMLGLHSHHQSQYRRLDITEYLPVHSDPMELGSVWWRRCRLLVHGLEQTAVVN